MAVCNALVGGLSLSCDNNMGGIKKLYLCDWENVSTITHGSPGDTITAITMASGKIFHEFQFNRNTSTFTEVTTSEETTGTEVCTQTITLVLNRREQTKRDRLLLVGKFKPLMAIVKDYNDKFWLVGENNGIMLTEKNSESGTAKSDRNGYTLTFIGEEPEDACEINSGVVSGSLLS